MCKSGEKREQLSNNDYGMLRSWTAPEILASNPKKCMKRRHFRRAIGITSILEKKTYKEGLKELGLFYWKKRNYKLDSFQVPKEKGKEEKDLFSY